MHHTLHLVVQSLEENFAQVELEDSSFIDLPRVWLPPGTKEGDHLNAVSIEGDVKFIPDPEATRAAYLKAQALLDAQNATDPGGDLKL